MFTVRSNVRVALAIALFVLALPLAAQQLVVSGGTIHTLAGDEMIGSVLIEDGKIKAVGETVNAGSSATVVDATGLHVYPGMFDAMSQIGLVEISSISATVDTSELGKFNPHLKAATAVHPASEVIPVTRANGITHALSSPTAGGGGVIPGQASLIHLDGWTIEEMAIDLGVAMVVSWPQLQTRTFDRRTFTRRSIPFNEAKEKAEEAQNELRDWLDAARHYAQAIDSGTGRTKRDLKLEALAEVLDRGKRIVVIASNKRDIEAAVAFADEQNLDIVIGGGREAWKAKELLAEKGIPVILGLTQSLPQEQDDPYDLPFRNAGELASAGVKIAFASGGGGGFGPSGPHNGRTLPYESAMATAYGLSRDEALRALTVNPAEILGVDDQLGTIEVGKIANLIVTDGDPLEMQTQVKHLIIKGQQVSTDNRHRDLYDKYRSRPSRD